MEWRIFQMHLLKELGLCIQLGHPIGISCINPRPVFKPFFVLQSNGIHEVAVDYCDCDKKGDAGNWRIQCLQWEWMPATRKNSETCCMFCMMELFHLQNLQAKTLAYNFYTTLAKLTDNTGTRALPVSPTVFMSISFQLNFDGRTCTGYFYMRFDSGGTSKC